MSKVFVSYKRVDKDKVFPIVEQLEKVLGIECWVDLTGIESDEQFSNVIVNAINECEVFLFMYSKSHRDINPKKDWTVREITFADKKEKRIVFVDLDGYELPDWFAFRFPDQQVIKAGDIRAMDKLVEDIRKWLRLSQSDTNTIQQEKASVTRASQIVRDPHHQTEDAEAKKISTTKSHPQAIDLGLPSGTKWASCNVGATKPEEYGGYFAWGETEEKDYYNWETYAHCDGDEDSCHDLGRDIAGTKYDVAHVKWGGNWRMPTFELIKELLENCDNEWSTLNGVKGRKFTSKLNGNSIFLPAAGAGWNDDSGNAGSEGYYWSSTQNPLNSNHAYYLFFYSGYAQGYYGILSSDLTVRPVMVHPSPTK